MLDFRNCGVMFDEGYGVMATTLDAPSASGRTGFIAYAAGRNKYLPTALCETEPKVQQFWMSCVEEMIAAGVDGVDFREENHSMQTDFPAEYGFNPVVLERCRGLEGNVLDNMAKVRGDAYTDFLRKCKDRLSASGSECVTTCNSTSSAPIRLLIGYWPIRPISTSSGSAGSTKG